jgi:hypothetical protein
MYNKKLLLTSLSAIIVMMVITTSIPEALAHTSATITPPPNLTTNVANKAIRLSIGETDEPGFTDEITNFEITIKDVNTQLPVLNAFRDYTNANAQSLWVDAYFYPKGTTPGVSGADCNTVKTKQNPTDAAYQCAPTGTPTATKTGQNLRNVSGKPGTYQAADQWYTELGLTLYHMYGKINYYNDVMIPIDIWTDGTNVKYIVTSEKVYTPSGSFALKDRTTMFWPVNPDQPENMREAMGDSLNLLEIIRGLVESLLPA